MGFIKIPELRDRLGVSESTARKYVKNGTIPAYKIGPVYKIDERDLEEFIEKNKLPKAAAPSEPGQLEQGPDFETPEPTGAKTQMNEAAGFAKKLAIEWNEEIQFYAEHGRELPECRPRGMRLEAIGVDRIYKKALVVLQRDAVQRGHPSDLTTLPPSEKKAFMSHLAALTALGELAMRIEEIHSSAQDERAIRTEFESLPDEDLNWMVEGQIFEEELARNRETAGVA